MPPKSSNKKNASAAWYFCEKCRAHITSKARDTHEKCCPIANGATTFDDKTPIEYIRAGTLYTSEVLKRNFDIEELKEVPMKFLNSLIFLSEGAISLAGFYIGQNVQIIATTTNGIEVPLVRSIWPIPVKFLTTVFVTNADYDTIWQQFRDAIFSIKGLPKSSISFAKSVCLDLHRCGDEDDLTETQIKDVLRLLKIEMKDLIYTNGSKINFNFFNKSLNFKVNSWRAFDSTTETNESENLAKALKHLSLDTRKTSSFFILANNTNIEIAPNEESETKTTSFLTKTKPCIGGLDEQMHIIEESMNLALGLQNAPKGIQISRGMLLYGASGCGKTLLCEAMSQLMMEKSKCKVIHINTSEVYSKFLGETEKNLSALFDKAYENYPLPSLIIVEDVNNLCPKNETNDISRRVSLAFASMLDALNTSTEARNTFLLATTSDIEAVCPNLRRCGRLDVEIEIGAPAPKARAEILLSALQSVDHDLTIKEIEEIAQVTHGFVGADLVNLISHATLAAYKNGESQIKQNHIHGALTHVKPSAMREVLIENPNVRWSDIGGQTELKLQLKQAIEWPLLYPEKFKRLGIKPPRGILMYGPPGCSKTMIAKALATESQLNFLSIKGPELFSMWVGESERAVREVFRKARQVAPSIVFFDEIDAIGGERAESSGSGSSSSVQERVLTQLLTELDGVEALQNVTIVAATNRPDMIDKALLRPGRIDRIVYVGLPDEAARREIFRIKLATMPLADDVEIDMLVQRTDNYTGAEIQAVCHEAALKTLEENLEALNVSWKHFEYALKDVRPRTSPALLQLYEQYATRH